MKIRNLLINSYCWIKGHTARDRFGRPCGANDPEATGWDLLGAINVCYPDQKERQEVLECIYSLLPAGQKLLCMWNDSATWEDICSILQLAGV
jgi:hypothetical protein